MKFMGRFIHSLLHYTLHSVVGTVYPSSYSLGGLAGGGVRQLTEAAL